MPCRDQKEYANTQISINIIQRLDVKAAKVSVSVCRIDLVAVDRLLDLFAHRFYVLVLFLSILVIPTCG